MPSTRPEPGPASHRFSRRRVVGIGAGAAGALAMSGLTNVAGAARQAAATPDVDDLEAAIGQILSDPRYRPSRLGLYVADLATGETVYDIRGDEWFLAASTTKVWAASAALDAYGPDFRFETPIYRTGEIGADGALEGDLVLVASGDLTMGGRDTPEGEIAFTPIDHINAVTFPELATLTPQDPLAGLDALAAQVAEAGITRVAGDVIIDDRLFPSMEKDGYILSPVWINDNLIDVTVTPGAEGEAAELDWRPKAATYQVENRVTTAAAGAGTAISISSPAPGQLIVEGQIPADQAQAVPTWQVEDPSAFARTLLIEALERAGVTVGADPAGGNPVDTLPEQGSYAAEQQVALHTSLPFSENLKLIMKTSHNQHADMLIFLLALKQGETDFESGVLAINPIIEQAGIDPALVAISDGRGNVYTDLFSPRVVCQMLMHMATRDDFAAFYDAMPILGVDGTETLTVTPESPVAGKAAAKSGTTVDGDVLNQRGLLMTRALAGYLTGQSGRELVFGLYLNNVPAPDLLADTLTIIADHGAIVEALYERT
jgi:D-alanyl-D-alanine carboxypeptidase/D-alanyl-D-alanine-endopeptidase (penicillin-binding protein 4)